MRRTADALFLSFFLLSISIPLLLLIFGEQQTISHSEKRSLAVLPKWQWTTQAAAEFPGQFENYFNDHFGLRDPLIRLYSYSLAKVLHTSPKWLVSLGKEDWLFLADLTVLGNFVGNNSKPAQTYHRYKQILQDRTAWLHQYGTEYIFTIAPDKMMIYPEYLPDKLQRLQKPNNVDELFAELTTQPAVTAAVDIRPALLTAKTDGQVYYKTDTHWNSRGAFAAYKVIMEKAAHRFPDLHPMRIEDLTVRSLPRDREDIALMINLSDSYREIDENYLIPRHLKASAWQPLPFPKQADTKDQQFREGILQVAENPARDRTAILITDSFGQAIRDFLAAHFKKTFHVTHARFEDITELIAREKPDVIVDLNVARAYPIALGQHKQMSQEAIKRDLDLVEPFLDIPAAREAGAIIDHGDLRLDNTPEGLRMLGTGPDPQLIVAATASSSRAAFSSKVVNLSCRITSSTETIFALHYLGPGDEGFAPRRMTTQQLQPGENNFSLRIYEPIRLDRLRIDPGAGPGVYTLHRLTLANSPGI